MENNPDILEEVKAYCESAGIAYSTLALRAINNARFFERRSRRVKADQDALDAIRKYMEAHPPVGQNERGAA